MGVKALPPAERVRAGADGHRDPQLVDGRAHGAVVGAGPAGGRGHEDVVEAPAQRLGGEPWRRRAGPGACRCCRRSERSRHSGERAGSDTTTCRRADRPSSTTSSASATTRRGSSSEPQRSPSTAASGHPEAASELVRERVDGRLHEVGRDRARAPGGPGAIGSVASRARSMNCSDIRMLPSPSAMAWWSFCTIAAPSSSRPSTTTNSHSGRVRSNGRLHERGGEVEQLSHRPRARGAPPSAGGSRGRSRRRPATPAGPGDPGRARRAGAGAAPSPPPARGGSGGGPGRGPRRRA